MGMPDRPSTHHKTIMKRLQNLNHLARLLLACLLFASAPACMYTHEDGELINPQAKQSFGGYASAPHGFVIAEALNRSTGQWQSIGYAFASGTPTAVNGGPDLYAWNISLTPTDNPSYACFASQYCYIPAGDHSIEVRFREPYGTVPNLTVFDQGGLQCVFQRLFAGDNMVAAGAACGSSSQSVTLKVIG